MHAASRRIPGSTVLVAALLLTVLAAPPAVAAGPDHALIRFHLDTEADQATFRAGQAAWDVVAGRAGRYADIIVPRKELDAWLGRGSRVEILQEDIEASYAKRYRDAQNFGVYHTYSEGVAWLDSLSAEYPEVVSAKWSLGRSHEGREIWCVRVSDNPQVHEPEEPEILFDGLHHARECMSQEMVVMLVEHLAEQYRAGDPAIVELVNGNAVYMVPWVNPDGYVYNEQTYPDGGGVWRKNRRDNGDGTFGVDLNRNYPFAWGCPDGSTDVTSSSAYRGPSPASEPEIQALMQFINAHDFVSRQSYHTAGDLTIYPWSYTRTDTPDHAIFTSLAAAMVQYNGYVTGQPPEVLYLACGVNMDWDYGQQDEHTKIFAFTNEIGRAGFWPPPEQRQVQFEDNLWPALYLIAVSGGLRGPVFTHAPVPFQTTDTGPQAVAVTVEGFDGAAIDPASATLHWRHDGGAWHADPLAPTGTPGEYAGTIPAIAGVYGVVEYYLAAGDVDGRTGADPRGAPDVLHTYEVATEFDHAMEADRGWRAGAPDDDARAGLWTRVDPVGSLVGGRYVQPEDDHTANGSQAWVTGQHVAGQSAGTSDVDDGKTTLYSPVYDLAGSENVALRYWRWYTNDTGDNPGEDWWDVEISNDGGQTWTAVEHTRASDASWLYRQIRLADYFAAPGRVQLRFVASDELNGSLVEAGVDDFRLVSDYRALGVGDDAPDALRVELAVAPNPFNPLTTLRFRLPTPGPTQLGVFDLHGRLIMTLVCGNLPAGEHAVTWNGRDALGRPVGSGVYFVRLLTPAGAELSRKLLLAK